MDIRNLDPIVAMHHLVMALRPGPFVNNLCNKLTTNLDGLHCWAAKYMQLEELIEYNRHLRIEASGSKKDAERDMQKGKERAHEPRYNYYISLNASRSRILEQGLATKVLAMPKCANTPLRVDPSKHCQYQRNKGHSTEKCPTLKTRSRIS